MKPMYDPKLVFMIDEAVKSMENREGFRSALYLRAAHDYIHNVKSVGLEICIENFEEIDNV